MDQLVDLEKLKTDKSYFTIEEVMRILNISQNTLYRYIDKGLLEKIKFKNRNYIPKQILHTYVEKTFGEKV